MGLDIYFHKTNRNDWERFQNDLADYENTPLDEVNEDENPRRTFNPKEVGYFRKVNFLMTFFAYNGNCEYKEIPRKKLEALHEACIEICNMRPIRYEIVKYPPYGVEETIGVYSEADQQRCAKILPTTSGFFFGGTDYDQRYFNQVKEVLAWVDGVLEDLADDEVVLMYCWW